MANLKYVFICTISFLILSFGAFGYLIYTSVNSQSELGLVINKAGLQRMLTQKLLAESLVDSHDEFDTDKAQLLEIHSQLVEYQRNHKDLLFGHFQDRLNTLYYAEPHFQIKNTAKFLASLKSNRGNNIPTRLFEEAGRLTKSYNHEVDIYQAIYEQQVQKIARHATIISSLVICGLGFLLIFIMLPFSKRLADEEKQLKLSAELDPLTGLFNRRAFYSKAESIFSLCRRQKQQMYVLTVDIDYFKKINDTYGHEMGDHILRHISAKLTQNIRSSDLASRFGGEEFVLLMPDSGKEETIIKVSEKIRRAIKSDPFSFENTDILYTVSIGVGPIYNFDIDVNSAIGRSDEALYEAKKNGRDQVVIWRKFNPAVTTSGAFKERGKSKV